MMKKAHARTEAAQRYAERLQREQDAPRLRDRVPTLVTLRFEITDGRNVTSDPSCRGGGHDVTNAVLDGLRSGDTRFEVEDLCYGNVGMAECGRIMRVEICASYR
jgi:hypothetical protein